MENKKPQGRMLLKVTGILYIVFGALVGLTSVVFLSIKSILPFDSQEIIQKINDFMIQYGSIDDMDKATRIFDFMGSIVLIVGIATAVLAVFSIVTGIINLVNCSKVRNYKICMVFSIIFLVLSLLICVTMLNPIMLIIIIAIPVLSIIGAVNNKKEIIANNAIGTRYEDNN